MASAHKELAKDPIKISPFLNYHLIKSHLKKAFTKSKFSGLCPTWGAILSRQMAAPR